MSYHDYPEEWLLPRPHDLAPRQWRLPTGEIVGEAINHEAVELLKTDPEEYFRITRRRLMIDNQP